MKSCIWVYKTKLLFILSQVRKMNEQIKIYKTHSGFLNKQSKKNKLIISGVLGGTILLIAIVVIILNVQR